MKENVRRKKGLHESAGRLKSPDLILRPSEKRRQARWPPSRVLRGFARRRYDQPREGELSLS